MNYLLRTALLALVPLIFLASGCSSVDKVLPKQDGTWNVDYTYLKITVGGTVLIEAESTNNGTMTFNSDGTGSHTTDGGTSTFTWVYSETSETISLTYPGDDPITMDVTENKSKSQKWSGTSSVTLLGVTTETIARYELSR